MADLDCWVIEVDLDPITDDIVGEPKFWELSREGAAEMVTGFLAVGHPVVQINGGVRVAFPNGYRDVILKESLEHEFRWKGPSDGEAQSD